MNETFGRVLIYGWIGVSALGMFAGLGRLYVGTDRTSRLLNTLPLVAATTAEALIAPLWYVEAPHGFEIISIGGSILICVALGLLGPGPKAAGGDLRLGGTLPIGLLWLFGFGLSLYGGNLRESFQLGQGGLVLNASSLGGLTLQIVACAVFYARTCRTSPLPLVWAGSIGLAGACLLTLTVWIPFAPTIPLYGVETIVDAAQVTIPFACAVALCRRTARTLRPVMILSAAVLFLQISLASFLPTLPFWQAWTYPIPGRLTSTLLSTASIIPIYLIFLLHAAIGTELRPSRRSAKWIALAVLSCFVLAVASLNVWLWRQSIQAFAVLHPLTVFGAIGLTIAITLVARPVREFLQSCEESLVILAMWGCNISCDFPITMALTGLYLPLTWVAADRFGPRAFWVVAWGGVPCLASLSWHDVIHTNSDWALVIIAVAIVALRTQSRWRHRLPDLRRLGWAEIAAVYLLGQIILQFALAASNLRPPFFMRPPFFPLNQRGGLLVISLADAVDFAVLLYAAVGGPPIRVAAAAALSASIALLVDTQTVKSFGGGPVALFVMREPSTILITPVLLYLIARIWAHEMLAEVDPAISRLRPWVPFLFLTAASASFALRSHSDSVSLAATAAATGLLRLTFPEFVLVPYIALIGAAWPIGGYGLVVLMVGAAWLGDRITIAALKGRSFLHVVLQPIPRLPSFLVAVSKTAEW